MGLIGMDIEKFIRRRKELKLSQVKLCKGICTQATLSKFERNGRVPSLSILDKLCARLGLTVDELNDNTTNSLTVVRRQLDEVERELMMEEYQPVQKWAAEADESKITAIPLRMQFFYLRGLLNALTNKSPDDILFDFSQILDDLDEVHQSIFTQLAYVGSGIMYRRRHQLARADFFFKKAYTYINQTLVTSEKSDQVNNYLRILTLIFYTADYYASKKDYDRSNKLIQLGVTLCSSKHVTYYLPRLKFLAAENAIHGNAEAEVINRLLDEALVFARINHNEVIQMRVAATRNIIRNTKNTVD
ncbi:DNA-binding helix-turn-helix protein [Lentilactobacillus parafarraginis F0439]|uniref:DNA-binding helix-turn-helix protein n=2 Tax=Lentilactobacillus parafarraginis TaxID=390842 RepID=G9ZTM5_9LACO|nr:DNA-binding helix-turn-helix protein [Lentilactobacillus parafarraginis F0439]